MLYGIDFGASKKEKDMFPPTQNDDLFLILDMDGPRATLLQL